MAAVTQEHRSHGQFVATRVVPAFQAAISRGQDKFADRLCFGAITPSWNNQILRRVLQAYGKSARRIAWIDLHTGFGPSGVSHQCPMGHW